MCRCSLLRNRAVSSPLIIPMAMAKYISSTCTSYSAIEERRATATVASYSIFSDSEIICLQSSNSSQYLCKTVQSLHWDVSYHTVNEQIEAFLVRVFDSYRKKKKSKIRTFSLYVTKYNKITRISYVCLSEKTNLEGRVTLFEFKLASFNCLNDATLDFPVAVIAA